MNNTSNSAVDNLLKSAFTVLLRLSRLPTLDELTRAYIRFVLDREGGNKTRASDIVGIDRRTLYRREEKRESASTTRDPLFVPAVNHAPREDTLFSPDDFNDKGWIASLPNGSAVIGRANLKGDHFLLSLSRPYMEGDEVDHSTRLVHGDRTYTRLIVSKPAALGMRTVLTNLLMEEEHRQKAVVTDDESSE